MAARSQNICAQCHGPAPKNALYCRDCQYGPLFDEDIPSDPKDAKIQQLTALLEDEINRRIAVEQTVNHCLDSLYAMAASIFVLTYQVRPYVADRVPAVIEDALDIVAANAALALTLFDYSPERPLGTKGKKK